ncbi:hypothetical protein QUF90_07245 [Desulfococcaceae bacterium HSG9]|nr:hypothetical protein [Desulfococcaceae bacterium HSG9]
MSGKKFGALRLPPNAPYLLSCMLCQFVCPVPGLITYKEMPAEWQRQETAVMDKKFGK